MGGLVSDRAPASKRRCYPRFCCGAPFCPAGCAPQPIRAFAHERSRHRQTQILDLPVPAMSVLVLSSPAERRTISACFWGVLVCRNCFKLTAARLRWSDPRNTQAYVRHEKNPQTDPSIPIDPPDGVEGAAFYPAANLRRDARKEVCPRCWHETNARLPGTHP